jgi:hypothetical protein
MKTTSEPINAAVQSTNNALITPALWRRRLPSANQRFPRTVEDLSAPGRRRKKGAGWRCERRGVGCRARRLGRLLCASLPAGRLGGRPERRFCAPVTASRIIEHGFAREAERSRRRNAAATSWWPASCAQRPQRKSNRLRLGSPSWPFGAKPSQEAGGAACNLFSKPAKGRLPPVPGERSAVPASGRRGACTCRACTRKDVCASGPA